MKTLQEYEKDLKELEKEIEGDERAIQDAKKARLTRKEFTIFLAETLYNKHKLERNRLRALCECMGREEIR